MKKAILSAALLIAVCISAKAQFSLGIKGGVNFSSINADNLKSSTVTGYQAGAFARLGGAIYLQPEVYLSSTGGHFESNDNAYSGTVKFTDLNVPVLLGARYGAKNLNVRVMAGPVFTSVLNTDQSLSQNFATAYGDFGHYRSGTVGYQADAGVDLGSITADLRYEGNISQVNPDHAQRQNLWALSIGFKIL
jgi:hypothetical protein